MKITSLASSSKGNCYIVNDGQTNLMIEAGLSLKQLREKGVNPTSIDGLLISHEHQDHSKYWYQLMIYTNVYMSLGTFEELKNKKNIYTSSNLKIISCERSFKIGTFIVFAFRTQHDAKEPFGFYLYSQLTKETVLFATDTYYINNRFDNLQYVMIECNYEQEALDNNPNMSKARKIRTMKSHFELSNVLNFFRSNDLSRLKEVYLMHLSNGNSNRVKFKTKVQQVTGVPVYVCEE